MIDVWNKRRLWGLQVVISIHKPWNNFHGKITKTTSERVYIVSEKNYYGITKKQGRENIKHILFLIKLYTFN